MQVIVGWVIEKNGKYLLVQGTQRIKESPLFFFSLYGKILNDI